MKKKYLMMMAAIVATSSTLMSCSEEETVNNYYGLDKKGNEIVFTPSVEGSTTAAAKATRATVINSANYKTELKNFGVFAKHNQGRNMYINYMGNNNAPVVYTSNGSNWTTTDTYFWPNAALSFSAYAPVADDVTTSFAFDFMQVFYTVPTDVSKQHDLLAASTGLLKSDTNGGMVNLQFSHLLSQVKFVAAASKTGYETTISGVTINNVRGEYLRVISQPNKYYNTKETPVTDYSIGLSKAVEVDKAIADGTGTVSLTDDSGVLMLVPQPLEAWDVKSGGIETADGKGTSYLTVTCKVFDKTKGLYVIGSAAEYGKVYIPFSTNWEAGKCYTYTLKFNGTGNFGYDNTGKPSAGNIYFSVGVSDWQDAGNSNLDI